MWSVEFYDDSEKDEIQIRKNQSSNDFPSISQSEAADDNDDENVVSDLISCIQNSLESPKSDDGETSQDTNSEHFKIERLVSQVSQASSNKTEESFVFVDHSDSKQQSLPPKGVLNNAICLLYW